MYVMHLTSVKPKGLCRVVVPAEGPLACLPVTPERTSVHSVVMVMDDTLGCLGTKQPMLSGGLLGAAVSAVASTSISKR